MISIISPAKIFKKIELKEEHKETETIFKEKTSELVNILKGYSASDLSKLMKMSQELGEINYKRYNDFYNDNDGHSGLIYFFGEAFKGIEAESLTLKNIEFAQEKILILSGLYGVIRPLDKIKEYRLEMGTKLENPLGKNLYSYWKSEVTNYILNELKETSGDKVLLNLASDEYSKVLDIKKIREEYKVITVEFKEKKGDEYKVIGMYAKKARGKMVRYIVDNEIDLINDIKSFNEEGYKFNEELSLNDKYVFSR